MWNVLDVIVTNARNMHGVHGSLVLAALACCVHLAMHDFARARLLLLTVVGGCLIIPRIPVSISIIALTYGYIAMAIGWPPGHRLSGRCLFGLVLGMSCFLFANAVVTGDPAGRTLAAVALCWCWLVICRWLASGMASDMRRPRATGHTTLGPSTDRPT